MNIVANAKIPIGFKNLRKIDDFVPNFCNVLVANSWAGLLAFAASTAFLAASVRFLVSINKIPASNAAHISLETEPKLLPIDISHCLGFNWDCNHRFLLR